MWCSVRRSSIVALVKAMSAPETGKDAVDPAEDQAATHGMGRVAKKPGTNREDTTHEQPESSAAEPHLPLVLGLPVPPKASSQPPGYAGPGHGVMVATGSVPQD